MEREGQGQGPAAQNEREVAKVKTFSDAQVMAALQRVVQERREVFRKLKDR